MNDRFDLIYAGRADEYHALVMREDWRGGLLPAIQAAADLRGRDVVELGAGTGRLTGLIAPVAARVRAFDRSRAMLDRAAEHLGGLPPSRVSLAVAENSAVPLPDACADVVIEGWSFGHSVVGAGEGCLTAAETLLTECVRLLRTGGTLVIVETLGTGRTEPAAPDPRLALWYAWLETERGFSASWIRTDYRFASRGEADVLTGPFFGAAFEYEAGPGASVILHECTGLWWKTKE